MKGSDHLAHSWGGLGRFLGSQWERQLKFSAYRILGMARGIPRPSILEVPDLFSKDVKKITSVGSSAFQKTTGSANICNLSISLKTQKSAKTPPAVGKMIRPFRFQKNACMIWKWHENDTYFHHQLTRSSGNFL